MEQTSSSQLNEHEMSQLQLEICEQINNKRQLITELTQELRKKIEKNEKLKKIAEKLEKKAKANAQKPSTTKSKIQNLKTTQLLDKEAREAQAQLQFVKEMEEILNEGRPFRVLICGIQSSGKSTFLNACIGQELLPGSQLGQTKYLLPIKFQEEHEPVLRRYDSETNSFQELKDKPIKQYVMENDSSEPQNQQIFELSAHFEFLKNMPELFKNKFLFIDSPGFNSTNLTQWQSLIGDNLDNKFDFIILVIGIEQIQDPNYQAAIKEFFSKKTVRNAIKKQQLIIIVNRIDQERLYTRDQLKIKIKDDIEKLTSNAINANICFISSQRALLAKVISSNKLKMEEKYEFAKTFYSDVPSQFRKMVVESIIREAKDYHTQESYKNSYFEEFQDSFIRQISQIFGQKLDQDIQKIRTFLIGFDVKIIYEGLAKNPENFNTIKEFKDKKLQYYKEEFKQHNDKLVKDINKQFREISIIPNYEKLRSSAIDAFSSMISQFPENYRQHFEKVQNEFRQAIKIDSMDTQVLQQLQQFQDYQLNISQILIDNEVQKFIVENNDEDVHELITQASSLVSVLSTTHAKWGYIVAEAIIAGSSLPIFLTSLFGGAIMFGINYQLSKKNQDRVSLKCLGIFQEISQEKFAPIFQRSYEEFIKNNIQLMYQVLHWNDIEKSPTMQIVNAEFEDMQSEDTFGSAIEKIKKQNEEKKQEDDDEFQPVVDEFKVDEFKIGETNDEFKQEQNIIGKEENMYQDMDIQIDYMDLNKNHDDEISNENDEQENQELQENQAQQENQALQENQQQQQSEQQQQQNKFDEYNEQLEMNM